MKVQFIRRKKKCGFYVQYSSCYVMDIILVEGASAVSNHGFDFITIEYGATGACSAAPSIGGGRLISPASSGEAENQANFYPNPVTTTAELRLAPGTKITNAVLSVYDITGRVIASIQNITSTTIIIDRGNLPKGLYFFKLSENGIMLSNGKFIITD